MRISVSMITLNEEKNIARALSSCTFADEIIVVDGGSTDRTQEIIQKNDRAVLIPRPGEEDKEKQRQISLEHCTGDWIIRLDAEEACSEIFEKEIFELLSSAQPDINSFSIRRCHLIGNEKYYSKAFDNYEATPRIWRHRPEIRWKGKFHDHLAGLPGGIRKWDAYIIYYGFLDKKRYWEKGEFYSKITQSGYSRAEDLVYREYDVQPRPEKSRPAPHVPSLEIKKDFNALPKVAIIRGPNLNQWEIQNYEALSNRFDITLYTTTQPRFDLSNLRFPVVQLPTYPEDPSSSYMIGLETELIDKEVVYSADITWMFTAQATAAKQIFGNQVIVLEWENIPFAHEENEAVSNMKEGNRIYADIFVAVTERARDALLLEGVPEEDIWVVPMGIDTDRFRPDQTARTACRQEFFIAEEDIVVLFTGRMVWEKGIYDLIYAAKLVLQTQKKVALPLKFVIIGKGPEAEEAQKRVSRLGMDNNFIFINNCPYDKMPDIYNMADIFILPSISTREWKEQFGMVLIEAMACGLPVISTTSGSISEVVGNIGLLAPPNDPTELAKAMIKLINDRPLRKRLSRQGRDRALHLFDSKKIAEKFGRLFEKAAQDTLHGAVAELTAYSKLTDNENFHEFFSRNGPPLLSLVHDHYDDATARAWADDIRYFCQERIPKNKKLNILDFGGGIGSLLIHLSRSKNLDLFYTDLPGKIFDYAKWRFARRGLAVTMLDASQNRCLSDWTFDVIIMINVAEYLDNHKDTIRNLLDCLAPEGFLIFATASVNNYKEPSGSQGPEQYCGEEFYDTIKSLGMEMLNKGLPRIFKKASCSSSRLKVEIEAAVKAERYDQAGPLLAQYLETHPFDLSMLIRYVETCIYYGDLPTARENLEKILLFNPGMPEAEALKKRITENGNISTNLLMKA